MIFNEIAEDIDKVNVSSDVNLYEFNSTELYNTNQTVTMYMTASYVIALPVIAMF